MPSKYKIKNGKLYRTTGGKDYLISNANVYSEKYTKNGKYVNKPQIVKGEYIIDGQGYSIADAELDNFLKNLPEKKRGFSFDKTLYEQRGNAIILKTPQQVQQIPQNQIRSATPYLDRLRKISLRRTTEQIKQRIKERTADIKERPLKNIALMPVRPIVGGYKILKGGVTAVNTLSGGMVELAQGKQSKLREKIQKKKDKGQLAVINRVRVQNIGLRKGVLMAIRDTSSFALLIPKLPKATFLFLKDSPIQKIKNAILNIKPYNIKISAKNLLKRAKQNPAETGTYLITQYFLFGGKLKAGKIKVPKGKIEKVIIKENTLKEYNDGLFYKWVGEQNPVLLKFKTRLNADLEAIRKTLSKIATNMYNKYKGGVKPEKPLYKDLKFVYENGKPELKYNFGTNKRGLKNALEITFRTSGWDSLSLREQSKLIGKRMNLVSAQADRLVYLLRRFRTIKKPIEGLKLTKREISLLNKLNRGGRLNKYEINVLNKAFKRTNKGLLAKSFFASPSTNVRVSRLGLDYKEAGLYDIFKGNFRLTRNKPQILLFVNQRIQNLPRNLKGIQRKLLSGKSLTNSEKLDLLTFQLKKSGRFKPIGFLTREAEVTLSPNEIIKRVKKLSSVRIGGRKIPIIQAEVVKVENKLTRNLMNRAYRGERLTNAELKKLNKGIQRESGLKSSYSYTGKQKPYLNLKSKLLSFLVNYQPKKVISYFPKGKITFKPQYYKGTKSISYVTGGSGFYKPRITTTYTPVPPSKYTPRGTSYPPKYPTYPKGKPPVKPRFRSSEIAKKSESSKKVGYIVYGLSGGKWLKLNKKPLLKQDALSRGSYAIDRTTAKTFKIVPVGKTTSFGGLIKREKGYFTRTKPKFREYKVQKGRRFVIKMKLIEKRKYGIDTTGEKNGLSLYRYLAKLKKQGKY